MRVSSLEKIYMLLKMARVARRINKNVSIKKFMQRSLFLRSFFEKEAIVKHDNKYVISTFMPPFPSKAFETMLHAIKKTSEYVKGNTSLPVPISTYISVTNKCMCHCYYCSNALHRAKKELSTEEIINIINQLQDYGVSIIGFTGGEPLLRNDLLEIIAAVDDRSSTLLFTTGIGLTEEMAYSLKNVGLFSVVISLDHYKKEEHNRTKNCSHAFDSAISAIHNAKEAGLYVALNTLPSPEMIRSDEIWKFLEFAAYKGVDEVRILYPIPTGRILGKNLFNEDDINRLKQIHIEGNKRRSLPKISVLAYLESKEFTGCGAGGTRHMYIDASGNLHPCDMIPFSFGNVLEEGLIKCMERMAKAFPRPHPECFTRSYYKELAEFMKKDVASADDYIQFCSSLGSEEMPVFFEKMV